MVEHRRAREAKDEVVDADPERTSQGSQSPRPYVTPSTGLHLAYPSPAHAGVKSQRLATPTKTSPRGSYAQSNASILLGHLNPPFELADRSAVNLIDSIDYVK